MGRFRITINTIMLPTLLVLSAIMVKMGVDELQDTHTLAPIISVNQFDLKYQPAKGLPQGAQIVFLRGDINKPGPYTIRMKLPGGYVIPPHWHSKEEQITVISGSLNIGMGDNIDKLQGKVFAAGAYELIPAGEHHYLWTMGDTVVQIDGTGSYDTVFAKHKGS